MLAIKSLFVTLLLIFLTGKISSEIVPTCNETRLDDMFPLSDPTLFYYCQDKYTPRILPCPVGTGFQYNKEAVGCVPWEDWKCTYKGSAPSCKKGTEKVWARHIDPNLYYACSATNTPLIVPCPDGSGFSYTYDMVGCVPWDMWECDKQII